LAQKINQIVSGARNAYRTFEFATFYPADTIIDVSDLDFTPRMVVLRLYRTNNGYDNVIMFISTIPAYSYSNNTYTGLYTYGSSGNITDAVPLTNITTANVYGGIKNNGFFARTGISGSGPFIAED